jgi:hypothetical protein
MYWAFCADFLGNSKTARTLEEKAGLARGAVLCYLAAPQAMIAS